MIYFRDFAADILNFIVCANKKAILPQFQDEMIHFPSRYLQEIKSHRIKLYFLLNIIHKNRVGIYFSYMLQYKRVMELLRQANTLKTVSLTRLNR